MRYALVNPLWDFDGSIYFGCREPHLPLEFGYSKAILEKEGHDVLLVDAHLFGLTLEEARDRIAGFSPDVTVITTAPSYLFWRCPPPELRVPRAAADALREAGGLLVAVGPHGSATPRTVLRKLGVDMVVMGEFEDLLPAIARIPKREIPSVCLVDFGQIRVHGGPHEAGVDLLPALKWPAEFLRSHAHHHHRFEAAPAGPGAEIETSRGCPCRCIFCARENFRNRYRKRPAAVVMEELEGLVAQGVEYVYFIDEIFLPDADLLGRFRAVPFKFGIQTRLDLWSEELIELLGDAGCVSIEAGVESITEGGRRLLNKKSRIGFEELTERFIFAAKHVPFVQANLLATEGDDGPEVERWREKLISRGVWANRPVPVFPYPGSPLYASLWGPPDDFAWERAHEHYLKIFCEFSDIQDQEPLPLEELESACEPDLKLCRNPYRRAFL